jgi:magnesium-transporting ATPase (P-type)
MQFLLLAEIYFIISINQNNSFLLYRSIGSTIDAMLVSDNHIGDACPALCLTWENSESDALTRHPRLRNESVFVDGLSSKIIIRGLVPGWVIYAMLTFIRSRGMV